MARTYDTMMEPRVEELLERAGSKFGLVALAARRARQINSYYGQLGDGLGTIVPPQVTSTASKSLSIAFEEIAADKVLPMSDEERAARDAEIQAQLDAANAAATADASDDDAG